MGKIVVTVGTTYCGCPEETFELECSSEEEFMKNSDIDTEIINAICDNCNHYFIEYEYVDDNEEIEENDDEEI